MSSWCLRNWYASPSPPPGNSILYSWLSLGAKLYELGLKHDQQRKGLRRHRLPAIVISIGNLVTGGTGKTPLALWVARHLRDRGFHPAILSRGYGRHGKAVAQVPSCGETLSKTLRFGDEPVLMAAKADPVPVWVGRERWTAGQEAIRNSKADILVLDDGFQHLSLERNLDLVLLDAHNPFGNGFLLPLGPLREPVQHLKRADAVILTRAEDDQKVVQTHENIMKLFPQKPVFVCRHRLVGVRHGLNGPLLPLTKLHDRPAVAFAGIARPESFFHTLSEADIPLSACLGFSDHRHYGRADVARLLRSVRESGARLLVTTQKDFVRLPAWIQSITATAEIEITFDARYGHFTEYLDERLRFR
jgi:tetraacyldisaccharide 4'-kinase